MSDKDCGCGPTGGEPFEQKQFEAPCNPAFTQAKFGKCDSSKGKFYDVLLEPFTVPAVGKEGYIEICEGALWTLTQWIAINLPGNKIAAFKVTGRTLKKLKLLNGCDKSGDASIYGNPDPGTVIPKGSVFYAIPPAGCENELTQKILIALEEGGIPVLEKVLADSTNICFTNIPDLGEDELGHLFAGTAPDCDCAPDEGWSSCFRKLKKILTGQSGKTLCMPDVAIISIEDSRLALFDADGCLKRGPSPEDLYSCENFQAENDEETAIDFLLACQNGEMTRIDAPGTGYQLVTKKQGGVETEDNDPDDPKWFVTKKGLETYPITAVPVVTAFATDTNFTPTLPADIDWDIYGVFELDFSSQRDPALAYNALSVIINGTTVYRTANAYGAFWQKCKLPYIKLLAGVNTAKVIMTYDNVGNFDAPDGEQGAAEAFILRCKLDLVALQY